MAVKRRQAAEDLDELLFALERDAGDVCAKADIGRTALWKLRRGITTPQAATEIALASELGVPRERVRAACAESRRRAAGK